MINYNARRKQIRDGRIAQGLCARCGQCPPRDGLKHCQPCAEQDNIRSRKHHAKYPDKINQRHLASNTKIKLEVMNHYGGAVCACCNESILSMLTLDHINNDGAAHRKELGLSGGTRLYYLLKREGYPPGLQVLCANCNLSKYINKGTCEHKLKLVD